MKKVSIIFGGMAYSQLFTLMGFKVVPYKEDNLDIDLICFTGGEDVSPNLYGDDKHKTTYNNPMRDTRETAIFDNAVLNKIPMVGICRGAQFLNVMSGGRMYQDVTNHTRSHMLVDAETGDNVYVSSTHHQMMMPAKNAIILAYSTLGGSREWYDGQVFKRDISNTDYEVLFYPETKCLCFQPHPEFMGEEYVGMQQLFHHYLKEKFGL